MNYRYILWPILIFLNIAFWWVGVEPQKTGFREMKTVQGGPGVPLATARQHGVTSGRSTAAVPKTNEHQLAKLMGQTQALLSCYQVACDFPNSDPRAYDLAVGQAIKANLYNLSVLARDQQLQAPSLVNLATSTLRVPDGHVKEAALSLILTQHPQPQTLQAVLDHVIDYHDGELMPIAIAELSRYGTALARENIQGRVAAALLRGGHSTRVGLAKSIDSLLAPENISYFRSIINQLAADDIVYRIVKAKIDEFEIRQSGA